MNRYVLSRICRSGQSISVPLASAALLLVSVVGPASAQPAAPVAGPAAASADLGESARLDAQARRIAPWVDDATMIVACADLTRIDVNALARQVAQVLTRGLPGQTPSTKEMTDGAVQAETTRAALVAAGAKEVWLVVSVDDINPVGETFSPLMVLPIERAEQRQGVADVIRGVAGPAVDVRLVDGAVIAWNTARADGATLPMAKPARVDAIRSALGDAQGAPIAVCLIPAEFIRKSFSEFAATGAGAQATGAGQGERPAEVDGANFASRSLATLMNMTAKTRSSTTAVAVEPSLSVSMVLRTVRDDDAAPMANSLDELMVDVGKAGQKAGSIASAERFAELFKGRSEAGAVRWTFSSEQLSAIVAQLSPAIAQARSEAEQVLAAADMRQLMVGCAIYAADNNGQWPEKLAELSERKYVDEALLKIRSGPAKGRAPNYVQPDAALIARDPAGTVVIYEPFDAFPAGGVWVGFADGSVRRVRTQDELSALLLKLVNPDKPADAPAKPAPGGR
jgi:hypothetical protein